MTGAKEKEQDSSSASFSVRVYSSQCYGTFVANHGGALGGSRMVSQLDRRPWLVRPHRVSCSLLMPMDQLGRTGISRAMVMDSGVAREKAQEGDCSREETDSV